MNSDCRQFRDTAMEKLIASPADEAAHAARCEVCSAWLGRVRRHALALGALERLEAPRELPSLVSEELRFDSDSRIDRIVSVLASLRSADTPAELDHRVLVDQGPVGGHAHDEPDVIKEPLGVQALRTLSGHSAPSVLERLIEEELEKPEYHRVNRFSDLEKMGAPDALARRLEKSLRPSIRGRVGSVIGSLAAAGLVAWLAVDLFQAESPSRAPRSESRPFQVVSSGSIDELHPWLRSGMGVLAGPRSAASTEALPGEELR